MPLTQENLNELYNKGYSPYDIVQELRKQKPDIASQYDGWLRDGLNAPAMIQRIMAMDVKRIAAQPVVTSPSLQVDVQTPIDPRAVAAEGQVGGLRTVGGEFGRGLSKVFTSLPKAQGIATALIQQHPIISELGAMVLPGAQPLVTQALMRGMFTGVQPAEKQLEFRIGAGAQKRIEQVLPIRKYKGKKGFVLNTLPSGAGSLAGFVLGGIATGGIGAPAMIGTLSLGAATEGAQAYEEAIAKGASEDRAFASFLIGLGIGTTEAVPIGKMFKRIDKFSGGKFKTALVGAIKGGSEELIQETFQQFVGNLNAKLLYDSSRDWKAGVGEGGAAGFFLGFAMNALGLSVKRLRADPNTTPAEHDLLDRADEVIAQAEADLNNPERIAQQELTREISTGVSTGLQSIAEAGGDFAKFGDDFHLSQEDVIKGKPSETWKRVLPKWKQTGYAGAALGRRIAKVDIEMQLAQANDPNFMAEFAEYYKAKKRNQDVLPPANPIVEDMYRVVTDMAHYEINNRVLVKDNKYKDSIVKQAEAELGLMSSMYSQNPQVSESAWRFVEKSLGRDRGTGKGIYEGIKQEALQDRVHDFVSILENPEAVKSFEESEGADVLQGMIASHKSYLEGRQTKLEAKDELSPKEKKELSSVKNRLATVQKFERTKLEEAELEITPEQQARREQAQQTTEPSPVQQISKQQELEQRIEQEATRQASIAQAQEQQAQERLQDAEIVKQVVDIIEQETGDITLDREKIEQSIEERVVDVRVKQQAELADIRLQQQEERRRAVTEPPAEIVGAVSPTLQELQQRDIQERAATAEQERLAIFERTATPRPLATGTTVVDADGNRHVLYQLGNEFLVTIPGSTQQIRVTDIMPAPGTLRGRVIEMPQLSFAEPQPGEPPVEATPPVTPTEVSEPPTEPAPEPIVTREQEIPPTEPEVAEPISYKGYTLNPMPDGGYLVKSPDGERAYQKELDAHYTEQEAKQQVDSLIQETAPVTPVVEPGPPAEVKPITVVEEVPEPTKAEQIETVATEKVVTESSKPKPSPATVKKAQDEVDVSGMVQNLPQATQEQFGDKTLSVAVEIGKFSTKYHLMQKGSKIATFSTPEDAAAVADLHVRRMDGETIGDDALDVTGLYRKATTPDDFDAAFEIDITVQGAMSDAELILTGQERAKAQTKVSELPTSEILQPLSLKTIETSVSEGGISKSVRSIIRLPDGRFALKGNNDVLYEFPEFIKHISPGISEKYGALLVQSVNDVTATIYVKDAVDNSIMRALTGLSREAVPEIQAGGSYPIAPQPSIVTSETATGLSDTARGIIKQFNEAQTPAEVRRIWNENQLVFRDDVKTSDLDSLAIKNSYEAAVERNKMSMKDRLLAQEGFLRLPRLGSKAAEQASAPHDWANRAINNMVDENSGEVTPPAGIPKDVADTWLKLRSGIWASSEGLLAKVAGDLGRQEIEMMKQASDRSKIYNQDLRNLIEQHIIPLLGWHTGGQAILERRGIKTGKGRLPPLNEAELDAVQRYVSGTKTIQLNEQQQQLADAYDAIRTFMADWAIENDLTVRTKDGDHVPWFQEFIENYWPQRLDLGNDVHWEKFVKQQHEMIVDRLERHNVTAQAQKKAGQKDVIIHKIPDIDDTRKDLRKRRWVHGGRLMRNLEYQRRGLDPEHRRDWNVILELIDDFSQRRAEIEVFGKNDENIISLINEIGEKYGANVQALAQRAFDTFTGNDVRVGEFDNVANTANRIGGAVNVLSLMGLSSLNQVAQVWNVPMRTSLVDAMQGMRVMFTKEGRQFAKDAAAALQDTIIEQGLLDKASLMEGKLSQRIARGFLESPAGLHFLQMDRLWRGVAANAGAIQAKKFANQMLSGKRGETPARLLREFGVDPDAIKQRGYMTDFEAKMAGRRVAMDTQFGGRSFEIPRGWQSPVIKFAFTTFKHFAFQQGRFFKNMEARTRSEVKQGNWAPLGNFLGAIVGQIVAGELINQLKGILYRTDDERKWGTIEVARAAGKLAEGDLDWDGFTSAMGAGVDTIAAASTAGIVWDMARNFLGKGGGPSRAAGALLAPTPHAIAKAVAIPFAFLKGDFKKIAKYALQLGTPQGLLLSKLLLDSK